MRLRLEGTQDEIANFIQALHTGFEVQEISRFYPNRGTSVLGRVYVTAVPNPSNPVQARATRITRATRVDRAPRGELEN